MPEVTQWIYDDPTCGCPTGKTHNVTMRIPLSYVENQDGTYNLICYPSITCEVTSPYDNDLFDPFTWGVSTEALYALVGNLSSVNRKTWRIAPLKVDTAFTVTVSSVHYYPRISRDDWSYPRQDIAVFTASNTIVLPANLGLTFTPEPIPEPEPEPKPRVFSGFVGVFPAEGLEDIIAVSGDE